MTPPNDTPRGVTLAFILMLACLLLLCTSAYFAQRQSIWVDESTQLSGLSLDPIAQYRWLAGWNEHDFGVPDDRMPPLSYWLGTGWSSVFGLSETSMRWFGIILVACGIPGLWLAARTLFGSQRNIAAAVSTALLLFALSPNIVSFAPEIRAYPLLISISCWACWITLSLLNPDTGRRKLRIALLTLLFILATLTHFYGLVMAGAVWCSIIILRLWDRQSIKLELIGATLTGIGVLMIAPFLIESLRVSALSNTDALPASQSHLKDIIKYLYRLVSHPASTVSTPGLILLLAGSGGLACFSIYRAARETKKAPNTPRRISGTHALFLIVLMGAAAPICVSFLTSGFDALKPSYSKWLIPFIALFLASGLKPLASRRLSALPICLAGCAIAGTLISTISLLSHRTLYSHGPSEWLLHQALAATQEHRLNPSFIFSVQDPWGQAYFPLKYFQLTGEPSLETSSFYNLSSTGDLKKITVNGLATPNQSDLQELQSHPKIWVRTSWLGFAELRKVAHGATLEPASDIPGWALGDHKTFNSFVRAEIRTTPPAEQ